MGLFDGYFDPEQFRDSGGLLGRLLSLQQQQGQYQPDAGFDRPPSVPQASVLQPKAWPNLAGYGPSSGEQTAAQNLTSQYQALQPVLGDHNAMLATVSPEIGKMLIAQALANQQPGNAGNVVAAGYDRPVVSDVSADPVRPGSQYAQAPMALCAAGPAGCAAGAGLTAAQAILGGAALGSIGAIILNNEDKPPAPGDKPASTPTGKRGSEINVIPGTNQPAKIGGRIYTGHAADQMQARGVPPSAVEDAIQNGQARPGNRPGRTLHVGANGVKVVTDSDGQVITVIPGKR